MNNIYIEGIQGAGKSTLLQAVAELGPQYHLCREGEYSPVELAWCTYMDKEQYEGVLERYATIRNEIIQNTIVEEDHYIVTYTKILTDLPGFHKDLEQFEIYNRRRTLEELKEIVLTRYRRFHETGYVFECAFFQNLVEDLILFHLASDDEIMEFYKELWSEIDKKNYKMLYLYSNQIADNIRSIRKERSDEQGHEMWYPLMISYFEDSPYAKQHHCKGLEDLIKHFIHRQQLELRIIHEVIKDAAILIPSKEWKKDELRKLDCL